MCGIAGIIDHENNLANKTEILTRMSEALAHRGPDEHGIYISAPAFIAHRRLSVIDPAFGKQPMTRIYENKKYTITYNGEIYYAEEIKKELKEHELTNMYYHLLEENMKEHPELWLWTHRRWKRTKAKYQEWNEKRIKRLKEKTRKHNVQIHTQTKA